jgi:hypothetical protein
MLRILSLLLVLLLSGCGTQSSEQVYAQRIAVPVKTFYAADEQADIDVSDGRLLKVIKVREQYVADPITRKSVLSYDLSFQLYDKHSNLLNTLRVVIRENSAVYVQDYGLLAHTTLLGIPSFVVYFWEDLVRLDSPAG